VKYAIRIPANENLERDVAELLLRPVGRPSNKPTVWYKGFLYKAASWNTARRVVAKVEHHAGELFPRIGFIVTNLETPSRAVVRFYNKRGTAEQWIKEGKQAVKMTRLSCHRFRSNEVRLWLSVIAYNLGQPVATAGAAEGNRHMVIDQLAAAAGEDGRAAGKARPLLLAAVGGEPPDAAPVWKHTAADRGFAAASRVGSAGRRNQSGRRRGVEGRVSERVLRNGENPGFLVPEAAQPGTPGALGWNGCKKIASGGKWGYIGYLPRDKPEVPVH
jgi:hypothetical protein